MSIEHWQSDDGRRAIERMGGVEWEDKGETWRVRCTMARHGQGWAVWRDHHPRIPACVWHNLHDHEALCLLRDAARVWLEAKSVDVRIGTGRIDARYFVQRFINICEYIEKQSNDYDAALIAAVLAVGESDGE